MSIVIFERCIFFVEAKVFDVLDDVDVFFFEIVTCERRTFVNRIDFSLKASYCFAKHCSIDSSINELEARILNRMIAISLFDERFR